MCFPGLDSMPKANSSERMVTPWDGIKGAYATAWLNLRKTRKFAVDNRRHVCVFGAMPVPACLFNINIDCRSVAVLRTLKLHFRHFLLGSVSWCYQSSVQIILSVRPHCPCPLFCISNTIIPFKSNSCFIYLRRLRFTFLQSRKSLPLLYLENGFLVNSFKLFYFAHAYSVLGVQMRWSWAKASLPGRNFAWVVKGWKRIQGFPSET